MQQIENKIFNMPIGVSFVDELARTLLSQAGDNKAHLADYIVLLPSRRACRSLRDAFLRITEGKPLILPRMQPIGDVNAEELEIFSALDTEISDEIFDIPDAISPLHRQILLAKIITAVAQKTSDTVFANSYIQALSLAAELGNLLDEVQTENLSFDDLKGIVEEKEFAKHWEITIDFLSIITEHWPKILKEEELIDPAERRNILLKKQAELWNKNPPKQKIIVAGVTGSIPAVRDLIRTIAKIDNSMIVLPAFDSGMSDDDWADISYEHPQYYLKLLLEHLKISDRKKIKNWPISNYKKPKVDYLIREAMRPAVTTDNWQNLTTKQIDETIFSSISKIDCKTSQEEALVIALAMREALETPQKTAVLVTPDRKLAKRVKAQLSRWEITCDDSAGSSLSETYIGKWLLLGADAIQKEFSSVSILAFLKHKFTYIGLSKDIISEWLSKFEIDILRSADVLNCDDIYDLLDLYDKKIDVDSLVTDSLRKAISEFHANIDIEHRYSVNKWLEAHIKLSEELAKTTDTGGENILWRGEAGEKAAELIHNILELSELIPELTCSEYVAFLDNMFKTTVVRPKYNTHPRLSILGQIEARLFQADLIIIGGVNEGVWPRDVGHDPWMSNAMRKSYGLPPIETGIGIDAHDFIQLISANEVIITRADNIDGSPTVPSRWLLRMDTVMQAVGLDWPENKLEIYAKNIDAYLGNIEPYSRPMPTPPAALRPRRLSVTAIEKLMRDPYSIYARYILGLKPLDDLEREFGPAERGQLIHKILERFISQYCTNGVPEDAIERLIECGREEFTKMELPAEIHIFWWARFERMAEALIKNEIKWQEENKPKLQEAYAEWKLNIDNTEFIINARADRIDMLKNDNKAVIIDYKTGSEPNISDIETGYSPQLPLEAVMLEKGCFEGISNVKVSDFQVWKLSGSINEAFKAKKYNKNQVKTAIVNAEKGIEDLLMTFVNDETPYIAVPNSDKAPKYNDYEDLERVLEWGYIEKN